MRCFLCPMAVDEDLALYTVTLSFTQTSLCLLRADFQTTAGLRLLVAVKRLALCHGSSDLTTDVLFVSQIR